MKKTMAWGLALTLVLSLFAGCGSALAVEDTGVTLTWAHGQGDDDAAVMQTLCDMYYEMTGVTVELVNFGTEGMLAMFAGGDAPDIMHGGPSSTAEMSSFYGNGWIVDMTPYMDEATPYAAQEGTLWKDTFTAGVLSGVTDSATGKILGTPLLMVSKDLHYNKDIFAELGLEVPTNLSELLACCKTIAEKSDYIPFSCMLQPTMQWNTQFIERGVMCDFWNDVVETLDIITPDGRLDISEQALGVTAGVMKPDDPRMVDYFSYMKELAKYFQTGFTAADWSFENLFNEGKSAMTTNGNWYILQHERNGYSANYGIVSIPYADKGVSQAAYGEDRKFNFGVCMVEDALYVTQQSFDEGHGDYTVDFARYLTSPVYGQKTKAEQQYALPTVDGVEVPEAMNVVMANKGDVLNPIPELYFHNFTTEENYKYCVLFAEYLTNDMAAEEFVNTLYAPMVYEYCQEVVEAHPEWNIEGHLETLK